MNKAIELAQSRIDCELEQLQGYKVTAQEKEQAKYRLHGMMLILDLLRYQDCQDRDIIYISDLRQLRKELDAEVDKRVEEYEVRP